MTKLRMVDVGLIPNILGKPESGKAEIWLEVDGEIVVSYDAVRTVGYKDSDKNQLNPIVVYSIHLSQIKGFTQTAFTEDELRGIFGLNK